jgi:protein-S-isoprenylcysteine O-methyltransferase Ste14
MTDHLKGQTRYGLIARRIRVPLGFLFAAVYLWLARPTWSSIAIGGCVAALGIWLRALSAGYVKKDTELTTTGPYAYTRNPLYLGSIIIALGFAVASRNLWVGAGIVLLFFAIYIPVIRSEETFLRAAFPEFAQYAERVPRLFPRIRVEAGTEPHSFSAALYRRHREYNALLGSLAMLAALALKLLLPAFRADGLR